MSESPLEEFQSLLAKFHEHQEEPTTKDALHSQLNEVSELLILAERILVYLATHRDMYDDLITYLFEYKQLLKLERHLQSLEYTLPEKKLPDAPLLVKPWWKFWTD